MKQVLLAIATASLAFTSGATVLTVNNNNPSPGQYIGLAAAQSAAGSGDTLYISGSPYSYNSFTFSKKLTLIGTGHKSRNADSSVARLDDVDFSGNYPGINIIGLDVNSINFDGGSMDSVYVGRCKVRAYIYTNGANTDHITIEGNYFEDSTSRNIQPSHNYGYITNWDIRNNVFNGAIGPLYSSYYGISNVYIHNNLFLYNGDAFYDDNRNLVVANNIFYRASPAGTSVSNTQFSNNLAYQNTNGFSASNGNVLLSNQSGINPQFVSFPNGGSGYSYAYNFDLQSASPALNAGSDGKDIGLTGGNGYFQKYGTPAIPQVRNLQITSPANGTISPGGTLQIQLISTIKR